MSKISNFNDSVIGRELHGKSTVPPRPNTHIDDRRLKEYNKFFTILEQGAECSIYRKCENNQNLTKIKIYIYNLGMKLFENEGESINGNSIFCEHDKKIKHDTKSKRNFCIFKGCYTFAWVSKIMKCPGSFYYTGDKMTPGEKLTQTLSNQLLPSIPF